MNETNDLLARITAALKPLAASLLSVTCASQWS